MPEYILTKGSINGLVVDSGESVDVEKGQRVHLSEEKARRFKWLKPTNKLAPVVTPVTPVTPVSDVDWSKYRDMKAPDLIAEVKDTDSIDVLLELRKVEEGGQNRIGVLREIEKKVRQLEEARGE